MAGSLCAQRSPGPLHPSQQATAPLGTVWAPDYFLSLQLWTRQSTRLPPGSVAPCTQTEWHSLLCSQGLAL